MADTFTTNLALTKPEVGASADTWGDKINDNLDSVDALFPSGALAVDKGGTGGTDASTARTNLGLGTLATQNASAVTITGGSAILGSSEISGTGPQHYFVETDAATDNKRWRFRVDGQAFVLQTTNDAGSSANSVFTVTRSGISPSVMNVNTTLQVSGNVAYHAGNISAATLAETQITDGSLLARVGSNETISGTWSYTTIPQKTGGGKFLHYSSSTYSGGAVTVSTVDPSGTPAAGDRWVKHAA